MSEDEVIRSISEKYKLMSPLLDERTRRLWCAAEASQLGEGGARIVCDAIELSKLSDPTIKVITARTIRNGIKELKESAAHELFPLGTTIPDGKNRRETIRIIRNKYLLLSPQFPAKVLRRWCGVEASQLGKNGATIVHKATKHPLGIIEKMIKELDDTSKLPRQSQRTQIRSDGAGSKLKYPDLPKILENLVEPGDPESPLRWTCKSTRQLSNELKQAGYDVGEKTVRDQLRDLKYRLKDKGGKYPNHNDQFADINEKVKEFLKAGQPVMFVDAVIKRSHETEFCQKWRAWCAEKVPCETNIPGPPDKEHVKAISAAVHYCEQKHPREQKKKHHRGQEVKHHGEKKKDWEKVGIADASRYVADSIRRWWWYKKGREHFPNATRILIVGNTDGIEGGSLEAWRCDLERRAKASMWKIEVCHFPPGTSKWCKIEQRLLSLNPGRSTERDDDFVTILSLISCPSSSNELRIVPVMGSAQKDLW